MKPFDRVLVYLLNRDASIRPVAKIIILVAASAAVAYSFGLMPRRAVRRQGKTSVGGPIRSGNLVFVGGIGGWYPERRPDGPGDVRQQFSDALGTMKASLERAGASMADVLSVRVALVDPPKHWAIITEVFNQLFPEPRPVCSCFGAAGFRRAGQLLQVECVCYID